MLKTQKTTYSKVAVALHWAIALLIIGQLAGGKIMMAMDPGAQKYELFQLHKSFGVIILILSVARLLWRLTHRPPALPDSMKLYERVASKITHIGFYVLIIGIPMTGWLMVSASSTRITTRIFEIIVWPDFPGVPRSESFEGLMKDAHEYMGGVIILLILLHIGAALKHHLIDKDDVLSRMVPFLNSRRK